MTLMHEMIRTHPEHSASQDLADAIQLISECAQVCTMCADSCLGEPDVANLVACIRLDLDCASICRTTSEIVARQTQTPRSLVRAQLQACIEACSMCAEECEMHAEHMGHCRVCAETCRRCEQACRDLLSSLS
jgi:hypothetical protein